MPDGVSGDAGTGPPKTTKERAHEALLAAGLSAKPPKSRGPRRMVVGVVVILVVLVLVVAGSLAALSHLKGEVAVTSTTSTTFAPPSTSSTTTTTVASGTGPTTTTTPLEAYDAASTDGVVLRDVGAGGQPVVLVRTASPDFFTTPDRRLVVVYWWDGGDCAACAAENLVVVSALEALGGTFHGLTTTTEAGPVATIDLSKATYDGPVQLEATEVDGANGRPDQRASQGATLQFSDYDVRPYTADPQGYPFLDLGGRYVAVGGAFTSALLAGLTFRQLATRLDQPDGVVSRAVLGNANELVAATCVMLSALSERLPHACANPGIVALEPTVPTTAPHGAKAPT